MFRFVSNSYFRRSRRGLSRAISCHRNRDAPRKNRSYHRHTEAERRPVFMNLSVTLCLCGVKILRRLFAALKLRE